MDFASISISLKSIAMTNKEILQASLLDILFEHRNKNYGAYELRKNYPQRMSTALGISMIVILMFLLFNFFKSNQNEGTRSEVPGIIIEPFQPEKKVDPQQPKPEQSHVATVKDFDKIQISNTTDVPDNEQLQNANPSN